MFFCLRFLLFQKNNARNIISMAGRIFLECLDLTGECRLRRKLQFPDSLPVDFEQFWIN